MALTDEQIKRLLALPKRKSSGRRSANAVDENDRSVTTWFKLAHKFIDDNTLELAKCSNEHCTDTRTHGQAIVEIRGQYMCRLCFLDGWLASNPDQMEMTDGS